MNKSSLWAFLVPLSSPRLRIHTSHTALCPRRTLPLVSHMSRSPMMSDSSSIEQTRVHSLNSHALSESGAFVLYWMVNSVRTRYNYALEYAAYLAETHNKALRVAYVFDTLAQDETPLPERHAAFQLESLIDVKHALEKRAIPFAIISPNHTANQVIPALSIHAAAVVTDMSYLRIGRAVRDNVASALQIPLYVIEADVVVPVHVASSKAEHAARTIRPKISRALKQYLVPIKEVALTQQSKCDVENWLHSSNADWKLLDITDIDTALCDMKGLDRGAPRVTSFHGGQDEAQKTLKQFLNHRLMEYSKGRNEPSKQLQSNLSPFLRAGNISPVDIALQTKAATGSKSSLKESEESFLEELIIRRELAVNACWFKPDVYDIYEHIVPNFAQTTLELHRSDERPKIYSYEELEAAVTDDPYWNAAQLEMIVKGKMHGYMRMYWVKRIIGWVKDPEDAMKYALRLNNRWELDAVDPNSYAGVIWCFGLHDHGWTERPIWGKIRYMNDGGLKRKFDIEAYVAYIDGIVAKEGLPRHVAILRKQNNMGLKQLTIQTSKKRRNPRKKSLAASSEDETRAPSKRTKT